MVQRPRDEQATCAESGKDICGRRLPGARVQFLEYYHRFVLLDGCRQVFRLAYPRPEDASGLVSELLLVWTSADDEIDQRKNQAGSQMACRLLLEEYLDEIEYTVLEVCCLALRIDIWSLNE